MNRFLADFGIETRVGVFENNVLFGVAEGGRVYRFADSRFCQLVNIGPFKHAGAVRRGRPFFAKGFRERFVGEEGEEAVGLGRGAEGVLGLKDVAWEMHFEYFEASATAGWARGLGGSTFSLRGAYGLGIRRALGNTYAI